MDGSSVSTVLHRRPGLRLGLLLTPPLLWLGVAVNLGLISAPGPNWLGMSSYAMAAVIAVNVWRGLPFFAIIVLAGLWLAPLGLGAGTEFAIILAATLVGCALFYEGGRRIGWLRPLIGLKPQPRTPQEAETPPLRRAPL